jgi:hypothetical protein
MEQIECSETSAIINQTPGNHPKEDILYRKNRYDINARVTSATYYSQLSKRSDLQLVS